MSEFKSLTGSELEKLFASDAGIDFENYNLDEIIEQYKGCRPSGYYSICIRLHMEPSKDTIKLQNGKELYIPQTSIDKQRVHNKFTRQVGLVVKFQQGAYEDKDRYKHTGPLCKVGDWVTFSRTDGWAMSYKKMATLWLPEDAIKFVVDDPRDVETL